MANKYQEADSTPLHSGSNLRLTGVKAAKALSAARGKREARAEANPRSQRSRPAPSTSLLPPVVRRLLPRQNCPTGLVQSARFRATGRTASCAWSARPQSPIRTRPSLRSIWAWPLHQRHQRIVGPRLPAVGRALLGRLRRPSWAPNWTAKRCKSGSRNCSQPRPSLFAKGPASKRVSGCRRSRSDFAASITLQKVMMPSSNTTNRGATSFRPRSTRTLSDATCFRRRWTKRNSKSPTPRTSWTSINRTCSRGRTRSSITRMPWRSSRAASRQSSPQESRVATPPTTQQSRRCTESHPCLTLSPRRTRSEQTRGGAGRTHQRLCPAVSG